MDVTLIYDEEYKAQQALNIIKNGLGLIDCVYDTPQPVDSGWSVHVRPDTVIPVELYNQVAEFAAQVINNE